MRHLHVPFIPSLAEMSDSEILVALETKGAKFAVDHVCWPGEYPYQPFCGGIVAHTGSALAILFHVRGMDLRSMNLADNGRQWEDSTCEFFVADPSDGTYYNFETNCIGTILGAKGAGRAGRTVRDMAQMAGIRRFSSLPAAERDLNGAVYEWTVCELIPFGLIGLSGASLPVSLRANFYKCADLTAHPHFLSWNPVQCPEPDFHRPEFFGELVLESV